MSQEYRWPAVKPKPQGQCIIHIGMHKTGSTSIQESLAGFEDESFFYARLEGSGNHSLPIFSLFAPRPERHHLHRSAGRSSEDIRAYIDNVWNQLDRSIAKARGRTLLISGEDISGLQEPALIKLRDCFRERFKQLTIVGYVRAPAGFIASSFQQRVKSGTIDFFDLMRMYRNYEETFGKFDRVFGRDNVRLYKFDPSDFPEGCAVQDFCRRIGIALPKRRIVRHNESLSRHAVAALYTYRKLGERLGPHPIGGQNGLALGTLIGGSDKFRFSAAAVKPVLVGNRSDIAWIEARLGETLSEDLDEERPGSVRDEADLLTPDPWLANRLVELLRDRGINATCETADDVALLVHALRKTYLPSSFPLRNLWSATAENGSTQTAADSIVDHHTVPRLVAQLRYIDPVLLGAISEQQAQGLLHAIFGALNKLLGETVVRPIEVAGLGQFGPVRVDASRANERSWPVWFTPIGYETAQDAPSPEVHFIVEQIRQHPELLKGITIQDAHKLLMHLFGQIRHTVARLNEGIVKYPGLGSFGIRKIERGAGPSQTRIWFRRTLNAQTTEPAQRPDTWPVAN
jgi:hypothetical protein